MRDASNGAQRLAGDTDARTGPHGPGQVGDATPLTALLERNRDVQDSRAVRLLAANNLALYVTLMQRHLDNGIRVTESDLVVRLERDLQVLGDTDQSGLTLIKQWANQGWLHRVSDQRGGQQRNVCYLTQQTRTVLDFMRSMRREDTIATGGSITGIAARLKQAAIKVGNDPARIRAGIEAQIEQLFAELEELDEGRRPQPNLLDVEDEVFSIARQMEQTITDIGKYGVMVERATRFLDEPVDTNLAYRDRQRRMYADYEQAWASRERASHRAFLDMVNNPEQRQDLQADIGVITEALPGLDTDMRKMMTGFFEHVGQQIDEVERINQRCAQRLKRFTAYGTLEQNRGVARQLSEALRAAHELLKVSMVDSRLDVDVPLARHAMTSIGTVGFKIRDPRPPRPAESSEGAVNLSAFSALAAQVDVGALAELVNSEVAKGPVSLPDAVRMVKSPYLGDVIVLWAWALKQPTADGVDDAVPVRFRSIDGRDRRVEVPLLMFSEPVPAAGGELDLL
jgi:hypothetical protein